MGNKSPFPLALLAASQQLGSKGDRGESSWQGDQVLGWAGEAEKAPLPATLWDEGRILVTDHHNHCLQRERKANNKNLYFQ